MHCLSTTTTHTTRHCTLPTDRFKEVRLLLFITKTRLFKYIENLTTKKGKKNQIKNSDIFHVSSQNIDRGYSLEPPRRGSSNEYLQSMFF